MPDVLIYTTPYCGYCVMAKRLLTRKGVTFREIDVANDRETRRWLVEVSGQRTVPQVFIAGQSYGGYDELSALDRAGKLDALLGVRVA